MAEEEEPKYDPKAKRKVRSEKYEEKVHFEGMLEEMIKMAGSTKPKTFNEATKKNN